MKSILLALIAVAALADSAWAQESTVQRAVQARPAADTQVGLYINVNPDCSSGVLPTIRLAKPPEHGRVTVKNGKVSATNYKQCLALQVPAYIAFYRPENNFVGEDKAI